MKALPILISLALLSGCTTTKNSSEYQASKPESIASFYDYQLASPTGESISLSALPEAILDADVILVGEWHTHAGIHRFQADLLKELINKNPDTALSMEQFTRDKQPVVDDYLASQIGEQILIKQGGAWPNYESDYRPLVELAKNSDIDIIASNAPKSIVRCIGRQGVGYLDKLDEQERSLVAATIDTSDSPYKEKFMASMHHGDIEQTKKQYAAQLAWDVTMAESIVNYMAAHPNSQVMHIAGKFHTEQALGTAAQIQQLNPDLSIVVITPVSDIVSTSDDYQLEVLPPPKRYVKNENRMKAYKSLKMRNDSLVCK
ncbi:ChaN family lipoprotein [Vibrio mediterranei]|uniref:ChaN family lipoprotein n=1 Tax=Vibrio mediterranei TaxID=689 RepID=UPI001EFEE4A3|nr:ChaN family lipoprotein [Vibrio mediterranei]MCG9664743.1 ChaN family lipoprotein [Vibrio mediterranei]